MVSANPEDLLSVGAKVFVSVPLIIPEERHIVWSLVISGNLQQLQELLAGNASLMHVRNQWGQSLMHVAAKIHQPVIFNFLLSRGIDPHLVDENQKTAATTVLTRRGSDEYDLHFDADDLADRLDWTPLHRAAALIQVSASFAEALLQSEYDCISSSDALGRTPLHWLAENGEGEAIRLLTGDPWKANVSRRDLMGFTALHCASWADSFDSVAALLDAGSNPNALDKHGRTPLLHLDDPKLLYLMIEKGGDVYIKDDEGANILHHASVADQGTLAEGLLARYGGSLWKRNLAGDTPLGLAIQSNSIAFLAVLLPFLDDLSVVKIGMSNLSKRNPLHLAALYASTEVMDMLAAARVSGLDSSARDKDGHSPNDCFAKCRGDHCAVARKSVEAENISWLGLMQSVAGETRIPPDGSDEVEKRVAMSTSSRGLDKASSGSTSEDEFFDACNNR
ncbi:ankyrin [Thozetella sp. PMI_491]|nr:ankyrin [Thozetella sp. PMI_491]